LPFQLSRCLIEKWHNELLCPGLKALTNCYMKMSAKRGEGKVKGGGGKARKMENVRAAQMKL